MNAIERDRSKARHNDPFPIFMPSLPDSDFHGARLRLFLPIGGIVLALIVLVWGAVIYRIAADERLVIQAVDTANLNLARAFEEHTVRTIKSVDQAVLFLKFQYEKVGDRVDIAGIRPRRHDHQQHLQSARGDR
jgi:hypothetical protein